MTRPSHISLSCVAALALAWAGCSVDGTGTGKKFVGDSGLSSDGGQVIPSVDSGKPVEDAGHADSGKPIHKPDAATPDMDAAMNTGMDSSMAMDTGVDAYIPPPPPPPPRLEPHLAGGGFSQSQGFRLYHSVGAPRPTNSLTPRAMSESAHYRLNSGLAVTGTSP